MSDRNHPDHHHNPNAHLTLTLNAPALQLLMGGDEQFVVKLRLAAAKALMRHELRRLLDSKGNALLEHGRKVLKEAKDKLLEELMLELAVDPVKGTWGSVSYKLKDEVAEKIKRAAQDMVAREISVRIDEELTRTRETALAQLPQRVTDEVNRAVSLVLQKHAGALAAAGLQNAIANEARKQREEEQRNVPGDGG